MRRDLFIGVLLFAICVAVFSPVYQADFIHWDDDLNITGNPHIQKLNAENLRWMFTDFSFMRRYVPMSWLTWTVTTQMFGLNARAFHIEGLLLHALNAAVLFYLLKRILSLAQKDRPENEITLAAALGALIWAVHPLRVEVVAWANCQMYAQSLLFLLGSLMLYLRAAQRQASNSRLILWSAVLFLFSLLSYPTAIAFVAILLVIDVFLLKRLSIDVRLWKGKAERAVLMEKLPFVGATLFVAGITLWARMHLSEFWKTTDRLAEFGWPARIAQAFYIWAYYIWKPWLSFRWSPVYTQLVSFRITDWPFVVSTIAVIAVTIVLLVRRARWQWALALWICHLAFLVPMLGLTEHPHYPNDRYNYLAAIVWSVLIALVVLKLANRKVIFATLAIVLAATWSVLSFQQTKTWRNSVVLFETTLRGLGNDPYRADLYWRLGKTLAAENDTQGALSNYKKSLEIAPNAAAVHVSMAEAFLADKQTNAALAEYETAVKFAPHNSLAHFNAGALLEQQDKITDAISHFRAAVESDAKNIDAYNGLARALGKTGQINEAMSVLQTVLQLDPANPYANFNFGNGLMQQNKVPEALEHFSQAVKSKPDFADAHYQLGTCLAMMGRVAEGLPHFAEATRLKPDFTPALLALGMASAQTGKFDGAIKAYRSALRLNPDFRQAILNLGWILASHHDPALRNGPEALALAKHAVELTHENDPESLDLLAAAYAECQRFPEAAATISKAISIANSQGAQNRAVQLQARLDLYRSERALRQ